MEHMPGCQGHNGHDECTWTVHVVDDSGDMTSDADPGPIANVVVTGWLRDFARVTVTVEAVAATLDSLDQLIPHLSAELAAAVDVVRPKFAEWDQLTV